MNCEDCKKYEDCKNGSGLTWPCAAYRPKNEPTCMKCHHIHPDNGNCKAVGGFCTAVPAAYCPLIPELQAENEKLRAEVERMKTIMRNNGIMTIPSKYPGGRSEWNIPKPRRQKGNNMERLTDMTDYVLGTYSDMEERLMNIEDILSDEYDLERLWELVQEQTCDTADVTLAAEATLRNLVTECKEKLEAVTDSMRDAQSKVNDIISKISLYDL